MFRIARVRIRWIRENQHESTKVLKMQPAQASHRMPLPHFSILFNPQNWRVRVRWVGFGGMNQINVWAWGFVILMAGIVILTRFPSTNLAGSAIEAEPAGL